MKRERSGGQAGKRVRIGVKPGQWGWSFEELKASWRAAEDVGFDLVSCFDHVTAGPDGRVAWDAPTLLAAMAGGTETIRLSIHVLNASLRNPFLLAAQIAVAQAASGGRVEVGLGAGSRPLARSDHRATGIPFPSKADRLARLEGLCRVLPSLWRGEEVSDEALGLRGASLGPLGIQPPPVIVGGVSDPVLEVAARHADGWNAVEADPQRFESLRRRLDQICQMVHRERPIEIQVQVFVEQFPIDNVRDLLGRMSEAGAETAILVLHERRGPDAVRELAEAVL